MGTAVVRDMIWLLGATLVLWMVHLYARVLPDVALLAVLPVLVLVMAAGAFGRARIRRRAFLRAHAVPGSALWRRGQGGFGLFLFRLVLVLPLAVILMVGLARVEDSRTWWLAALVVVLLPVAWHATRHWLRGQIAAGYRPEACWRLVLPPVLGVLFAGFTWLTLHRDWPDFTGISLERALWHMVDAEQAHSVVLTTLLELAAAKDGFWLWLGQHLMPALERPGLELAGWALMLTAEALFVLAWLAWLSGVMVLVHHGHNEYEAPDH